VEYSPIASPLRYDRATVRPVVGLRAGCEANAWCAAGAGDVIARSGRTELSEVGVASGHCPTLQWGSLIARPQVSATTRTVIAAASGALRAYRVWSCSKPSTPASIKRCYGRLTPTLCAIYLIRRSERAS